jgi:hypothetical protein
MDLRIYNRSRSIPSIYPILRQLNTIHISIPHFIKFHFNIMLTDVVHVFLIYITRVTYLAPQCWAKNITYEAPQCAMMCNFPFSTQILQDILFIITRPTAVERAV